MTPSRRSRFAGVLLLGVLPGCMVGPDPTPPSVVTADAWDRPYSRQQAAYPCGDDQLNSKLWPAVARIDNAYGDRNLVCSCPSVEEMARSTPTAA